jgi:selenocysteine lyase/cysteine desulfurase
MPVNQMIGAMDSRTRVVACSLVSFTPGFLTDAMKLGDACRKAGVLTVVDGAQGIGIVHVDVRKTAIDVLSVSTQKGLCALYGLGFLYVRSNVAEALSPAYLSRFGVDLGDAHEATADIDNYRLMPSARRFEVGNYNYLGAVAVEPSLEIIESVGTETIQSHVTMLGHALASRLLELGIPVYGGNPGPHMAHVIALGNGFDPHHSENDDSDISSFARMLRDAGIRLSVRRGMIRLSLHLYNDRDDVEGVVDAARRWNRARNMRP